MRPGAVTSSTASSRTLTGSILSCEACGESGGTITSP